MKRGISTISPQAGCIWSASCLWLPQLSLQILFAGVHFPDRKQGLVMERHKHETSARLRCLLGRQHQLVAGDRLFSTTKKNSVHPFIPQAILDSGDLKHQIWWRKWSPKDLPSSSPYLPGLFFWLTAHTHSIFVRDNCVLRTCIKDRAFWDPILYSLCLTFRDLIHIRNT